MNISWRCNIHDAEPKFFVMWFGTAKFEEDHKTYTFISKQNVENGVKI